MNELTDAEILKALECCVSDNINTCDDCPFFEQCENYQHIEEIALDLINRQKAEIERLQNVNDSLGEAGGKLVVAYKKAKSEARKEVVDVVRKELLTGFGEVVTADMLDRINTILAGMEGEGNV